MTESGPMTHEDRAIWSRVFLKAGGWPEWSRGRFQRADRRDADIMRIGVMNPWCLMTWQQGSPAEPVLLRGPKRGAEV